MDAAGRFWSSAAKPYITSRLAQKTRRKAGRADRKMG